MLELEEDGKLNTTVRLKKRALQGAYDQAIKKKKVSKHSHSTAVLCLIVFSRLATLEGKAGLALQDLTRDEQALLFIVCTNAACKSSLHATEIKVT